MLKLAVLASVAAAAEQSSWTACPVGPAYSGWNVTSCPATQSCSPNGFSAGGGWGCCPWPNGVACGNGFACCPSGTTCSLISGSSYSSVYNCTPASGGAATTTSLCPCKPGAPSPPDPARKNVLVIGDSLTIGYTPLLASELADIAFVQHAPWDVSDGGAEEVAYFEQCLDNWLASPSGMPWTPDLIYFNSGMHNLATSGTPGHGTVPGQGGNASEYEAELLRVTARLVSAAQASGGKTTLMYGLTTPWLCDASIDGVITGTLNTAAAAIMASAGIWTVDMHGPIVEKCGQAPVTSCFGVSNCYCPHCPSGYGWLAQTIIAPAIRAALTAP